MLTFTLAVALISYFLELRRRTYYLKLFARFCQPKVVNVIINYFDIVVSKHSVGIVSILRLRCCLSRWSQYYKYLLYRLANKQAQTITEKSGVLNGTYYDKNGLYPERSQSRVKLAISRWPRNVGPLPGGWC